MVEKRSTIQMKRQKNGCGSDPKQHEPDAILLARAENNLSLSPPKFFRGKAGLRVAESLD